MNKIVRKLIGIMAIALIILSISNMSVTGLAEGWTDPANDVRYFRTNPYGDFWADGPKNASIAAETITEKWSSGTLTSGSDCIDIREVSLEEGEDNNLTITIQFDASIEDCDFIFIVVWGNSSHSTFYGVLILNATIGIDATYQFKNSQNRSKKGYLAFSDNSISAKFPMKWWGNESDDRELNVLSGTIWTNDESLYMDVFPNSLVGESATAPAGNEEETTGLSWFFSNWWWVSFLILALLVLIIYLLMKQNRKMKRTPNSSFMNPRDEYYSY